MSESATREFHLGDILTITTGRLVSPRHVAGIYDILNFMTGDDLMTHQLPRAMDECQGPLLAQHPDLAAIEVPDDFGDGAHAEQALDNWLTEQAAAYGETREVAPLNGREHARINPVTELRTMVRPDAEIITVITPGQETP